MKRTPALLATAALTLAACSGGESILESGNEAATTAAATTVADERDPNQPAATG